MDSKGETCFTEGNLTRAQYIFKALRNIDILEQTHGYPSGWNFQGMPCATSVTEEIVEHLTEPSKSCRMAYKKRVWIVRITKTRQPP